MSSHPARRVAALYLGIVIALGTAATALGADRIPVKSVDDTSTSLVNRIGAVDNVVVAMDARIERVLGALPEGHPPSPTFEALTTTQASLDTLISTIDNRLCSTDGVIGTGDASLADADVYAGDSTSTGLTNQLGSVRTVLAEANGRLVRIAGVIPAGPPTFELDLALSAVRNSSAAGYDAIAGRLGGGLHPPSPCHST
jgi:hypothetical protein